MKHRILAIFGTRPEAIKMAPVVKALQLKEALDVKVCTTGQHRHMLGDMLRTFQVDEDFELNIMKERQTLSDITTSVISGLEPILMNFKPSMVLVHGDTSTSFAAALSAFYQQIPVAHVEAGLRTGNKYSPFPEEINRRLTASLTDLHFAPTEQAKVNLLSEHIEPARIFVTGNTVIDALKFASARIKDNQELASELHRRLPFLADSRKLILVTGHRRENFGDNLRSICHALLKIASRGDVDIVYPVHPNPNVTGPVSEILGGHERIHLIPPLGYFDFVALMSASFIVLTDSGGIQEEAPSLGKPVLVMRDTTERPEAVSAGTAVLVGTSGERIIEVVTDLLDNDSSYSKFAQAINPYGDGYASSRIANHVSEFFLPRSD